MADKVSVSEKPWSDYTAADYTPEQWHAACLIHQHEGAPTSKNQCKLPVRTPNGTLNRNGVHAAAAALAGARGGVNASPAEKAKAASAIRRFYSQLDEKPPPSLKQSDKLGNFLAHFGIKGMRWGVRRDQSSGGSASGTTSGGKAKSETDVSTDAEKFVKAKMKNKDEMSNEELRNTVERARLTKEYDKYFNGDPDGDLQRQVTQMNLQKQYGQLNKELNPSGTARALKLIASASAGYLAYKKLDKASGGQLSKNVNLVFSKGGQAPRHRALIPKP